MPVRSRPSAAVTRRRRRGLSGRAGNLPRRGRTLAGGARHVAPGRASNRGQPAPARGVREHPGRVLRGATLSCLWQPL